MQFKFKSHIELLVVCGSLMEIQKCPDYIAKLLAWEQGLWLGLRVKIAPAQTDPCELNYQNNSGKLMGNFHR